MSLDDDWSTPDTKRRWAIGNAGMGAVRIALLFGSAAVALALLLTPFLDARTSASVARGVVPGIDYTTTGSVGQRPTQTSYTIRRSVLQPSPESVCIVRPNGSRTGDC